MKRIRITYPGAYHHVMNRGYDGNPIFAGSKSKSREIDPRTLRTLKGKRQRGELLVHLKERAGMKYKEIGKLDVFGD